MTIEPGTTMGDTSELWETLDRIVSAHGRRYVVALRDRMTKTERELSGYRAREQQLKSNLELLASRYEQMERERDKFAASLSEHKDDLRAAEAKLKQMEAEL